MSTAQLDAELTKLYTGGDCTVVKAELIHAIEQSILEQPRSQQKLIGPSEMGIACTRCLASKLAQIPERPEAAWLPYIGTAVHEQLAILFAGKPDRYMAEQRVNVGQVAGINITGSCDLFDYLLGVVIDFKVVGAATLKSARANGPSAQYKSQAHLYGKGWANAGYTVQHVAILYLPRNDVSLSGAHYWTEPYDQAIADQAIERCDLIARAINTFGPQTVLDQLPEHTGEGFSCRRYGFTPDVPTTTAGVLALR